MRVFVAIVLGLSLVFSALAIDAIGSGAAAASITCDHHAMPHRHGHDTAPLPGKRLAKSCCILHLFTGLADIRVMVSRHPRDVARAPDDLGAPGLNVEPAEPPPRA